MSKPTPAQLRALEAIQNGRVKWSPYSRMYYSLGRPRRPRRDVIGRVAADGLAERRGTSVILTVKGRAALLDGVAP